MKRLQLSWIKIVFAVFLLVGLPVFIWAVATQRIELRKHAEVATVICWNRVQGEAGATTDVWSYFWPSSCKGDIGTASSLCEKLRVPLSAEEMTLYNNWVASGSATPAGCGEALLPSATPESATPSGKCNNLCSKLPGIYLQPCLNECQLLESGQKTCAQTCSILPAGTAQTVCNQYCPGIFPAAGTPPLSPIPVISYTQVITTTNPWTLTVVASNLSTTLKGRLIDEGGQQWGTDQPVTLGNYQGTPYASFQLPSNTPPSACNAGKTCIIGVYLVTEGGALSNIFNVSLPSAGTAVEIPTIATATVVQRFTPWAVGLTGNNLTGTLKARLIDTTGLQWGTDKPVLTLSSSGITILGFQLPGNIPPSRCNADTSCTIGLYLVLPDGRMSNKFNLTLPRVTPGIPTPTLIPTPIPTVITTINMPMKFRVKLAGVNTGTAADAGATLTVKFYMKNGTVIPFGDPLVKMPLIYEGNGIYKAERVVPIRSIDYGPFAVQIKVDKHLGMRFCQQSGQTAPCDYSTWMSPTNLDFDFTGRPMPAGDLNNDSQVDANDIKTFTDLWHKTASQLTLDELKSADVNYNGVLDQMDLNEILKTLSIRYNE